nr:exocyst complex component SEC8 [Ipomoea batatas]
MLLYVLMCMVYQCMCGSVELLLQEQPHAAVKELLDSILDTVAHIFENHVIVGELLESKSSQQFDLNTPKSIPTDINWNLDSDISNDTGGYSIGFSLTVLRVLFFCFVCYLHLHPNSIQLVSFITVHMLTCIP